MILLLAAFSFCQLPRLFPLYAVLGDLTFLGTITVRTITDGTATLTGGALTGLTTLNASSGVVYTSTGTISYKTIGVADDNALEVDGSPNDDEYARFTANGIEGRTEAEFKGDFNLEIGTDILAEQTIGIADNNLLEVDHASPADNDYAKFTVNGLEGRSYAEVLEDLGVIGADTDYAEMYLNANGNPSTIETANTPIALRQFTIGSLQNFTFDAGSTGAITIYANYAGTVAGTVKVTSNGHGLTTDDFISIRGSANYKGIFQITTIAGGNEFYFTHSWDGDDGASDWDEPSHLIAGAAAAGEYTVEWDMSSAAGSGGDTFIFCVYNNTTAHLSSKVQRKFANNDVGAYGGCGIILLAAGDWIFLTASNDGTGTITNSYGALILSRL